MTERGYVYFFVEVNGELLCGNASLMSLYSQGTCRCLQHPPPPLYPPEGTMGDIYLTRGVCLIKWAPDKTTYWSHIFVSIITPHIQI